MGVKLESESIEIGEQEMQLARSIASDFDELTDRYRGFYVTVFLNRENRRLCLKFSNGELKRANLEKIDKEDD